MIKKMILLVVAILLMEASMTGCSVLEKGIDEYSKDKEECVLNTDNVTQFTYKGDSFTILDDTLSNSELGEWVGYIRKLAVVDSNGKILGTVVLPNGCEKEKAFEIAKADERIASFLEGKNLIKEIYVPNKIINFVAK